MGYFKMILQDDDVAPQTLCINIDGTAGTGKSFLIWAITTELCKIFHTEHGVDPVVRLAPTGIAAYGIRGWTLHFGLSIPGRKAWSDLSGSGLACWNRVKLLIIDEKSMVGRTTMGMVDRRLRQIFPESSRDVLGDIPVLLFGDFAQLPPIGDQPLFSDKPSKAQSGLSDQGRRVIEAFQQTVTLQTVFRQSGEDQEQVAFRDALLRQRTYDITPADYELFSTQFWTKISQQEKAEFSDALHLLPTKAAVREYNLHCLASLGKPVLCISAKHNCSLAKKASEEDADGLELEIMLAEGASVMITRNLWTSKG